MVFGCYERKKVEIGVFESRQRTCNRGVWIIVGLVKNGYRWKL